MKNLSVQFKVFSFLLTILTLLAIQSCGVGVTPKKQLTTMYGIYNSQYTQYMASTGYRMNIDGDWEKVSSPDLTDDQKKILRKKKEILTQMYSLVKLYDSMVIGTIPYSSTTEQELLNLIDQLAKLGGV